MHLCDIPRSYSVIHTHTHTHTHSHTLTHTHTSIHKLLRTFAVPHCQGKGPFRQPVLKVPLFVCHRFGLDCGTPPAGCVLDYSGFGRSHLEQLHTSSQPTLTAALFSLTYHEHSWGGGNILKQYSMYSVFTNEWCSFKS